MLNVFNAHLKLAAHCVQLTIEVILAFFVKQDTPILHVLTVILCTINQVILAYLAQMSMLNVEPVILLQIVHFVH